MAARPKFFLKTPRRASERASESGARFFCAGRARRAFTLIEMVLVIALIGLFAGIIAAGAMHNYDFFSMRPPDRILISAMKRARTEAIARGREMTLTFDKRGFFIISDTETSEELSRVFFRRGLENAWKAAKKESVEPDWEAFPNSSMVYFYPVVPEVIGKTTIDFSEEPVNFVRFASDSSMTPVRVLIKDGVLLEFEFGIDPFSASPLPVKK